MKKVIFFVSLLLTSNCFAFEIENTIQKDMTYDEKPEKIIYRVWGESWDSPDWSFSIYDGENLIYQAKSDEKYWAMTVDRGDWQDCSVIAECKEKMYGPGLIAKAFDDVGVDERRYGFMLETFKRSAIERYQQQFGIPENVALEYTNRLYEFLSGKEIVGLSIPGYHGCLLTYDKFMNTFVTYYAP